MNLLTEKTVFKKTCRQSVTVTEDSGHIGFLYDTNAVNFLNTGVYKIICSLKSPQIRICKTT